LKKLIRLFGVCCDRIGTTVGEDGDTICNQVSVVPFDLWLLTPQLAQRISTCEFIS
jgi:hypothetical protein